MTLYELTEVEPPSIPSVTWDSEGFPGPRTLLIESEYRKQWGQSLEYHPTNWTYVGVHNGKFQNRYAWVYFWLNDGKSFNGGPPRGYMMVRYYAGGTDYYRIGCLHSNVTQGGNPRRGWRTFHCQDCDYRWSYDSGD